MEIITQSPEETQKLGKKIAVDLVKSSVGKQAKILALHGELGSGKTTFVQGIARGLGLPQRLVSPTFILVREYPLRLNNFHRFYHIDLYRTETKADLVSLGFSEIFTNPGNVVIIEWAERLKNLLPKNRIDIRFSQQSHLIRKIKILK